MSENPKHVVFFGETGTGKSSAINLLLGKTSAPVSNDSQPCTQTTASYGTTLKGTRYTLWDTCGLGEGSSFLRNILRFGAGSEKALKKFLERMRQGDGIDLLVFCIRGSRATKASVRYYNNVRAITRQPATPVVIVVTHLEREVNMDDWWNKNSAGLQASKMEFDDHVCISTLPDDPRTTGSREKLVDMITKKRCWEAKDSGHYLRSSIHPTPKGRAFSLFKVKDKGDVRDRDLNRRSSSYPDPSSPTRSSYHTARSIPPSPVVEAPTSSNTTTPANVRPINTRSLGVDGPSQPSSEDGTGISLYSMVTGPQSSNTSHSQVHLQPCTEESEECLMNELPFKRSTATVIRRKDYATIQGSFGDIWECDLISGESSSMVAVKAVKTGTSGYGDLRSEEKKLRRELKVWGRLEHRNIVPLLGIVPDFGPLPSMVSPWFRNGSLSSYLARHKTSKMDKHRLLGDIATGVCYLHSQNVIHGDLHSDNVLIDDHGTACLTDFGLSFLSEFVGTPYLKSSICGGVHFTDPALVQRVNKMDDRVLHPTKPCDVYSFGGLMLHVLSGKKPFGDLAAPAVFVKVLNGERPKIPTNEKYITLWHQSLIRRCWDHEECKRPLANELVKMFTQT